MKGRDLIVAPCDARCRKHSLSRRASTRAVKQREPRIVDAPVPRRASPAVGSPVRSFRCLVYLIRSRVARARTTTQATALSSDTTLVTRPFHFERHNEPRSLSAETCSVGATGQLEAKRSAVSTACFRAHRDRCHGFESKSGTVPSDLRREYPTGSVDDRAPGVESAGVESKVRGSNCGVGRDGVTLDSKVWVDPFQSWCRRQAVEEPGLIGFVTLTSSRQPSREPSMAVSSSRGGTRRGRCRSVRRPRFGSNDAGSRRRRSRGML